MNNLAQHGQCNKGEAIKVGLPVLPTLTQLILRNKSNYHLCNPAGLLCTWGRKQFQNFISYIECR